jgi:hypothetical protein
MHMGPAAARLTEVKEVRTGGVIVPPRAGGAEGRDRPW